MIRRLLRSKLLWFSVLGIGFLAWSWIASMQGTRGVSWRSGDRSLFLAVSDGSVRRAYEGKSSREPGFDQWSIPRGQYLYGDEHPESGWFASAGIHPYPAFEGMILTMPHWLLVALFCGMAGGTRVLHRRWKRRMERVGQVEGVR